MYFFFIHLVYFMMELQSIRICWKMAEGSAAVPSTELLEWPKKDKRRLLHAVYRVGDLDRTIK